MDVHNALCCYLLGLGFDGGGYLDAAAVRTAGLGV